MNWRRFFDINELAALRVEDEDVFEAVHEKSFALFGEGLIDGFRIDHVDGLTDPAGYCRRLRARLAELASQRPGGATMTAPYVVVEKILGRDETLPAEWQCDGTTGYDFMDQVSAVLHDPAGEVTAGPSYGSRRAVVRRNFHPKRRWRGERSSIAAFRLSLKGWSPPSIAFRATCMRSTM